MIVTLFDDTLLVGPAGPQEEHTTDFPFAIPPGGLTAANATVLRLDATGTIGSGVWLTGQTPPGGWSMLADSTDWPLNTDDDPAAPRYGLIGTFEPDAATPRWFFIGSSRLILPTTSLPGLASGPLPVDVSPLRLRLAVNEPNPDADSRGLLGSGEGHWRVHVQVLTTDGDPSTGTPLSCTDVQSLLSNARDRANTRQCPAVGRAKSDRDTDLALTVVAWSVFGVLLAAVVALGAGVAGAHIPLLSLPPDPTPVGVATRVVAGAVAVGTAAASAAPAAASGGLGTLIAFWVLLALTIISFALALAATVIYMDALATFNNAVSQWDALLVSIQDLIDAGSYVHVPGLGHDASDVRVRPVTVNRSRGD